MGISILAVVFLVCVGLGYVFYSRKITINLGVDSSQITPSHRFRDGEDFVPTRPFYLFAQHFSAIAAAGPIAGPIAACLLFGWAPCLLWIGLGVIFIGAVHDCSSLFVSIRHEACSIADVAGRLLGKKTGLAAMAFIWIALVYIIVAFTDITASAFVSASEELEGLETKFNPGGAVAAASLFYLLLSLFLGGIQKIFSPPLWLVTLIFVPATFAVTWAGTLVSEYFILEPHIWIVAILIYCGIASLFPVWSLLQPRGYLGGFVLYVALFLGVVGVFFGHGEIQQPAFKEVSWGLGAGSMFPFLFVTIACGACSGFHGLVCSGTTSKQIDKEGDVRSIGYGAMLAEGFVAFMALVIVMVASPADIAGMKPGTIYGRGIGKFLTLLIGENHFQFAMTFGAMAFSTFVFDTLDVSTRLGRYLIQELTGYKNKAGAIVATLLMILVPGLILLTQSEGSWTRFWTLFGAANQLLAALTLLFILIWLKENRRKTRSTFWPMVFVFLITGWALVSLGLQTLQSLKNEITASSTINLMAVMGLLGLAMFMILQGIKVLRR